LILKKFQSHAPGAPFFAQTLLLSSTDTPQKNLKNIEIFIKKHNLHYPLIVKPDDGVGGVGLHFIKDEQELHTVLSSLKKDYVLQEYVSRPHEFAVFYTREPGQARGRIRSITRRYTIKKEQDPELMIPTRKIICKDESHLITPALTEVFNDISKVEGFYFGRFDIRIEDINTFCSQ
jgi:hypothetical protein